MVKSIGRMRRVPSMCCFMGTVTMTYWSLSQKKVARNKHKKLGMRFRYSTCLNQISLNNLWKSTFSSMSVSANQNTASSSIVCSKYLNLCSRQFNFVGSTVLFLLKISNFNIHVKLVILVSGRPGFWLSLFYPGKLDFFYSAYPIGYVILWNTVCGTRWKYVGQGNCWWWSCMAQAVLELYWYLSLELHHVSFFLQHALLLKVTELAFLLFNLVWRYIKLTGRPSAP